MTVGYEGCGGLLLSAGKMAFLALNEREMCQTRSHVAAKDADGLSLFLVVRELGGRAADWGPESANMST